MSERFGVTNPRALALRFHAQTGGSTLTAQQPELNIVRVAIQALSAVCGGASRCTRTPSTRRSRCRRSARRRSRCARSRCSRTRSASISTADPLGGSYFVEALTDELEARALELIARIDELGGAVAAVEAGWIQGEIEAAAYEWTSDVEAGRRTIVGVNAFTEEEDERIELHRLDPESIERQVGADARGAGRPERGRGRPGARRRRRRGTRHREPAAAASRCPRRVLHGRRDLRRPARRVGRARSEAIVGVISVARISVTPVKCFRLNHPDEVLLGADGVAGNRLFFLVSSEGERLRSSRTPWPVVVSADYDRGAETADDDVPRWRAR